MKGSECDQQDPHAEHSAENSDRDGRFADAIPILEIVAGSTKPPKLSRRILKDLRPAFEDEYKVKWARAHDTSCRLKEIQSILRKIAQLQEDLDDVLGHVKALELQYGTDWGLRNVHPDLSVLQPAED